MIYGKRQFDSKIYTPPITINIDLYYLNSGRVQDFYLNLHQAGFNEVVTAETAQIASEQS
jgi:hypothetical protein